MKTYVLIVSRVFPKTHKRAGEPTFFREMILSGLGRDEELVSTCFQKPPKKIHTIRANYSLWKKRVEEVQRGEAIIAVRYWSGKPYNSKQLRICELDKDSGVGVQQLFFSGARIIHPMIEPNTGISEISEVSENDGLSLDDFKEWFKGYDLSKSMAVLHFTKFRY